MSYPIGRAAAIEILREMHNDGDLSWEDREALRHALAMAHDVEALRAEVDSANEALAKIQSQYGDDARRIETYRSMLKERCDRAWDLEVEFTEWREAQADLVRFALAVREIMHAEDMSHTDVVNELLALSGDLEYALSKAGIP